MARCSTCDDNARLDSLPSRDHIAADRYWRAAHAFGTRLPGWLVVVPLRHVTTIAELTDAEAAVLGQWQVRLSRGRPEDEDLSHARRDEMADRIRQHLESPSPRRSPA